MSGDDSRFKQMTLVVKFKKRVEIRGWKQGDQLGVYRSEFRRFN